jgi:CHASE1-domain containing sensor protein
MPRFGLRFFLILAVASVVIESRQIDYIASPGIPATGAERFVSQAQSIAETIRSAWREAVTFPQLALAFVLASNTFPDRYAFERFTTGKYWDHQKTIYQIQWVPNVSSADRNGSTSRLSERGHIFQ